MTQTSPWAIARTFAGVLLDLDGTLVNSVTAIERSWAQWGREFGVDVDITHLHGIPSAQMMAQVAEPDRARAHRRILELELADLAGVSILPGSLDWLTTLREHGIPHAIVTSGELPLATARLRHVGLPVPDVLITADQVTRGKPDPEPFRLGAERLGLDPATCLAVEDAVAGLRAARAAGVGGLLAVGSTVDQATLAASADLVAPSLADVRLTPVAGGIRVTGR